MTTYVVTTTSDSGDDLTVSGSLVDEMTDGAGLSLREAVILANANAGADTITFDNSLSGYVITLSGGAVEITDAVTIDGDIDQNGSPDITVDGNDQSRVFNISNSTAISTLRGLVVTGGYTAGSGESGGGIYSRANLTVEDCTITGNSTAGGSARGGGIYAWGTLDIVGSIITGNGTIGAGADGGGINGRGRVSLSGSTVSGNSTSGHLAGGGGIYGVADLTLTNSAVNGNTTAGSNAGGGGISGLQTVTLINSTISGNSTAGVYADGGGVMGAGAIIVSNSTVSGNTTFNNVSYGGGLCSKGYGGLGIVLQNSVVLGNAGAAGRSELFQSTVHGAAISKSGGNIVGLDVFLGAVDVGDTSASQVFAATVRNNGVSAGILANNGGPVGTIALNRDMVNPALDASDTAGTAQDARSADAANIPGVGNENGAGVRDLGAFEALPEMQSLVVTSTGDRVDALDGETSLREAIVLANATSGTDTITFDTGLSGQTITLSGTELEITDGVIINGDINNDGSADITVDGASESRVFNITNASANTTLHGLIVTGGHTLSNSEHGGGIRSDAALTVENSTIAGNSTAGTDAGGGGIYGAATITVTKSTISGNMTTGDNANGGGVLGQSTVTLIDSTVNDNSTAGAFASGGGISGGSIVTVTNSTFSSNYTAGHSSDGGGIYGLGNITVLNSTISGNGTHGVSANGGGIAAITGMTLINSIVLGNATSYAGVGADQVSAGTLTLAGGNILGRNNAEGADIFNGGADVGDISTSQVFALTADNNGMEAGILADNGGPVLTIALRRAATNPALDSSDGSGTATDARGEGAVDIPGIGEESDGPVRDLGAFEALFAPVTALDDGFSTDEDTAIIGDLLDDNGTGADSDPAGLGLTITEVNGNAINVGSQITLASGALLTVNADGTFSYDPFDRFAALGPDQSSSDSFTYTVEDGDGSADSAGVTIIIQGRNETLLGTDGDDTLTGFSSSDDQLFGKGGNDLLEGKGGKDSLSGGSGRDRLEGGGGADSLIGGTSSDILAGDKGSDTLRGDAGNDTLFGGTGNDRLLGGDNKDSVKGEDGDDTLKGGRGNDQLQGGRDSDTLNGGEGHDGLKGDAGHDNLRGLGGDDTLKGGSGNDVLVGGDGRDELSGQNGNDRLDGGNGRDVLNGGKGADDLTGGASQDTFVFGAVSHLRNSRTNCDVITDFTRGVDLVDLSGIDARSGSGNQSFEFIGTARFSGQKGELRYAQTNAGVSVQGDVDGDGKSDFQIVLKGIFALDAGDFIL